MKRPSPSSSRPLSCPRSRPSFEEPLWRAAEGLRGHVEPAEYKHLVLGLLFVRFATDASLDDGARSLPERARWDAVRAAAREGGTARVLGDVTAAVERARPSLAGLASFGARGTTDAIDESRLARLVEAIDAVPLGADADSRDVLGRVYEYFLAQFASSEGRSGGEYYTPRCVVQLLVEAIRPLSGSIYDPCCGTGGMFVQAGRLLREAAGGGGGVALFGQESSARTRRLARMNLAIRGMTADLGEQHADVFRSDLHAGRKADFVLANPPFNANDWSADTLATDARWRFGVPPRGAANYAWLQHVFDHLGAEGVAGVVLANGSLSSGQAGEAPIRRRMIEDDVVECIVALPAQLFYGTPIPACIWILSPSKTRGGARGLSGRVLFVDARSRGRLVARARAELADDDVTAIARAYHRWRAEGSAFRDVPGFAKSASLDEIRAHRYALVPGRYVGFARERRPPLERATVEGGLELARARLAEVDAAGGRALAGVRGGASGSGDG
jgi:type I restriction enzyme M protein